MSMPQGPTVFVVDRDAVAREAVRRLVAEMDLPCEAFETGRQFLDAYGPHRRGCLITEVRVPEVSGLQIQQALLAAEAPLPVIFLSAHASVSVIVQAMKAGALYFLEKPPVEQELWEAIQEAIRESEARSKDLAKRWDVERRFAELTPEEREVLFLLAEHDSARSIASALNVSVRTVELRRNQLMKKVGVTSSVQLLQFAIRAADYVLQADHPLAIDSPQ
jgi:FixJ family two-component response regulator